MLLSPASGRLERRVDSPAPDVWSVREGKVVYLTSYGNPADALEAAGLSEYAPLLRPLALAR